MTRSPLVRSALVGLLGGLLFAGCWGCATHRVVIAPQREAITYEQLAGYLGVTFCYNGQARSFVSTEISGPEEAATRAHEAKHRDQYNRYPSCEQFGAWYRTPVGMIETEAEAYAAGFCVAAQQGVDTAELHVSYVNRIVALLGSESNRPMIEHAFTAYAHCGRP